MGGVKVFDMGRNMAPYAEALQNFVDRSPEIEAYARGRVEQFLLDLLLTGRAALPNGEVLEAYPLQKTCVPPLDLGVCIAKIKDKRR